MSNNMIQLWIFAEELAIQSGYPHNLVLRILRDYDAAQMLPDHIFLFKSSGEWLPPKTLAKIFDSLKSGYEIVRKDASDALNDILISADAAREACKSHHVKIPRCIAKKWQRRRGQHLTFPELPPPPPPLGESQPKENYSIDIDQIEVCLDLLSERLQEIQVNTQKGNIDEWYPWRPVGEKLQKEIVEELELLPDCELRIKIEQRLKQIDKWFEEIDSLVDSRKATISSNTDMDGEEKQDVTTTDVHTEPTLALSDYMFQKKGSAWLIRYNGGKEFILMPSKGAAYLHELLSNPKKVFSVIDLYLQVAKAPHNFLLGDAGFNSDKDALSAYRVKYDELEEELKEAEENNDLGRRDAIQQKVDALAQQIKSDKGLGHRIRKAADDRERIRKAFLASIRRAKEEIAKYDPEFSEHLKSPILRCGKNPCYSPNKDIIWDI